MTSHVLESDERVNPLVDPNATTEDFFNAFRDALQVPCGGSGSRRGRASRRLGGATLRAVTYDLEGA